ncbi:protein Wnt-9a-like [Ixodes scapularis]
MWGLYVLRHGIRRVCKCHGLSGSCSAKTCWEELAHFPDVAKALKRKYSKAIIRRTTQKPKWLRAVTAELQRLGRDRLVYLEESPSFCERNVLTGGMSQRRCRDHAHCEQVCCGRGHRSFSETVQERCHCRVVWCCQLECKTCTVLKYSHSCH